MLIVEDDAMLRGLIGEVVAELGTTVLQASNSDAAIAWLQSGREIDLMITDVNLPGALDGCGLAERARDIRLDLKILFITGHADHAALRSIRPYPPTAVLQKPFSMRELTGAVCSMIGQAPSPVAS